MAVRVRRNEIDEVDLIQRAKAQDPRAMRAMYDAFAGYLMGVCSRYVPERDDAKDILQDSFVKIFGALQSFEHRGEGALRAWMTRIVVNEALGFIRSQRHYIPLEYDDSIPDNPDDEPDVDEIPTAEIHRMIGELPVGYRTVFNLYVLEEKSHKEIAQLLGIGADSSASQLSRAKKLLAKKINEYRERRRYE